MAFAPLIFQCYGCEAIICGQSQPSRLICSADEYHQCCVQCAGAMADKDDYWCRDAGDFKKEQMRYCRKRIKTKLQKMDPLSSDVAIYVN
jgi:hypothetical protein